MRKSRFQTLGPSLFLFAVLSAAALPVRADVAAFGVEAGVAGERAFVGLESSLNGDLREGFVQRVLLDWQSVSFDADGTDVTRRTPSAGYWLGYRRSGATGWWRGLLGLEYRNVEVSPAHVASAADEEWRLGLQFDGELRLTSDWLAGGRIETYPQSGGRTFRGRLLRELPSGYAAGPEFGLDVDDDHESQRLGLMIRAPKRASGLAITGTIGVQRDDEGDVGGYIGIEFTRDF